MVAQVDHPQTGRAAWRLVTLTALPEADLALLVQAARQEGYDFVDRLVDDFRAGRNRFDQPGERLFAVYEGAQMIAIGGLNRDPYAPNTPADMGGGAATGRVRHVYVMPEYRRLGVGRFLMDAIIDAARLAFGQLTLRTFNPDAAAFYCSLGFVETRDIDQASHLLRLG